MISGMGGEEGGVDRKGGWGDNEYRLHEIDESEVGVLRRGAVSWEGGSAIGGAE